MQKSVYSKNIFLNYFFILFKNMNLTSGIWMLLLISNGQSLMEVGILEGIFHVTSFLMETPTGVIADIYGKKISRLMSLLINILSLVLFITSHGFVGYTLAFITSALSYNLESGAGEALVYDSLIMEHKSNNFIKISGNIEVIVQLTTMLALFLGGFIGDYSYRHVFIVTIIINIFTFIIGLGFKEPVIDNNNSNNAIPGIKKQYEDCFSLFMENKKVAYLLCFSAAMMTLITVLFFYLQVYWKSYGITEFKIGIFLACSCIFGAVGGKSAYSINKALGAKTILCMCPLLYVIGIGISYYIPASIISFSILSFLDSVIYVSMRQYIHEIIPSDKRATIISFESTLCSFFMICLFPAFGGLSDLLSMKVLFLILSLVVLVAGVINIIYFRKIITEDKY